MFVATLVAFGAYFVKRAPTAFICIITIEDNAFEVRLIKLYMIA